MLGLRRHGSSRRRATRLGYLAVGAAAAALIALLPGGPALAASAAGQPGPSPAGLVTFGTDVLPGLSSFAARGPTAATQPVEVGITLSNPHAAAQSAAYHDIYTQGSPNYHHFLSADQVAQQFGVPLSTFSALKAWATRDGLAPAFSPNTNEYLLLQGTAAQAEKTFSVALQDYAFRGQSFYANTTGPTVPTGLGINGVIGLNNKLGAHTTNHLPSSSAPHGTAAPRPAQTTCAGGACVGLTTPQDLWSIYQQPTDLSNPNADFGQGQQMAVLGEGAVSGVVSDLRAFEHEHALPQVPVTIHSVGDDFQDTSGNGEWDIDMQASTGMAPKAFGETLYFAKDLTDASVLGDISAWGSDPTGPYQANASFGECEQDPTSPVTGGGATVGPGGLAGTAGIMFTHASENALQAATLQGKTLFSSTGDTGSSCPVVVAAVIGAGNGVLNQGYPETNYPASSPYATAVGGTVLYSTPNTAATPADPQASNAKRFQETAWTFTGGGNTLYIPEPDYQHGIPMLDNQPCLTQPDGTPYATPTACRGIPDVTAQSGDIVSNGYAVTMSGVNDQAGGGTSLASPLWVGMWTRIQAAAPLLNGKYSLGFANCELYSIGLDHNRDPNDFFDIGSGPPASPTTGNGIYASLPRNPLDASGWDYVSGLGAPKVTNLARDLTADPTLTPRHPLTPPPAQDCGQPGLNPCAATCSTTSGLWSNSPHTATDTFGNSDPQLSLLRGAMSTTADGKTLRLLLTVTNLSQTVPTGAGAAEWYMSWSYHGTQYFGNAELSAAPMSTPTYHDGTVTKTGNTSSYTNSANTNDSGRFVLGPNGVVEIDVPLANVGSPPAGAVLSGPAGLTDIEIGTPQSGGLLEKIDSGGPTCDYPVGGTPQPPA